MTTGFGVVKSTVSAVVMENCKAIIDAVYLMVITFVDPKLQLPLNKLDFFKLCWGHRWHTYIPNVALP